MIFSLVYHFGGQWGAEELVFHEKFPWLLILYPINQLHSTYLHDISSMTLGTIPLANPHFTATEITESSYWL
jgi:hypothetical protein